MKSKDIIECNACHVCDGELYEGWRVGCDDLVFRAGAEEAIKVKEEEMREKAIDAFNEAMIFYTSAACSSEQEALDHFITELNQVETDCSEKPNDQKAYTGKICGNCDAYCECGLGPDPAKHDDPACPGFDDSVLSQLKEKK